MRDLPPNVAESAFVISVLGNRRYRAESGLFVAMSILSARRSQERDIDMDIMKY